MVARIAGFLALGLCVTPVTFGADAPAVAAPRPMPQTRSTTAVAKDPEVSAGEHLRLAARQLEAAGLTNEAATIRSAANQLDRRAKQELADLTRQIAQLQKKSDRLQQFLGRSNQIAYKCRFLELSAKSAAEFYAAAGLAEPEHEPANSAAPRTTVCLKAAEAFRMLREAGKLTTLAELSITTRPDQPAIATTGGEFPILIGMKGSLGSFDYRRFGYRCEIEPTLLASGILRLEADAEIAERDTTSSVEFNGLAVPAVTTRKMHVTVEMGLGESLVMNMGTRPRDEGHSFAQAALEGALQLVGGRDNAAATGETVLLVVIAPIAAESCSK
jgi:Bacterial type II and III secretion system protein